MFNSIRRFIERGKKGYCHEDLWNFDNWLSSLLAKGLKEFKQQCHGYPNDINDWDTWMGILDELIDCFEEQSRGIDNIGVNFLETYNNRRAIKKAKLHKGLELLERYYYDLWY